MLYFFSNILYFYAISPIFVDFKRIFTAWVPYALEPNGSGAIYGGSSGSIWQYVMNRFPLVSYSSIDLY